MNTPAPRYKRGMPHPTGAGLVFLRYKSEHERWVTPERLVEIRATARISDKRWKKTDMGLECLRRNMVATNSRPKVQEYRSSYYKRSEVRARYRAKYAADPQRAESRLKAENKKAERAVYLSSPEYEAKISKQSKDYYERNKADIFAKILKRRRETPEVRIKQNLSRRIRSALKSTGTTKHLSAIELIGCSIPELKSHLESQFSQGMTWDNYGEWHIDHEHPCAMFSMENEEQQKLCFNFRNLRPMWAKGNQSKSDFITHDGKQVRARDLRKIIQFQTQQAA